MTIAPAPAGYAPLSSSGNRFKRKDRQEHVQISAIRFRHAGLLKSHASRGSVTKTATTTGPSQQMSFDWS